MSLSGSVEDLPLLEILQVVSFCAKTGYLTVRAPEGEAAVVFRAGRVVSGFIWDVPPLAPDAASTGPAREALVRQRIASTLERLVRLREGDFGFNLTDGVPARIGGRDLSAETLADGIHPEQLMLDLARQMDEDRRDCAAVIEASFTVPAAADEEVLEELDLDECEDERPGGPAVLLVDDEPEVRQVVSERLRAAGFDVSEAASVEGARREVGRLAAAGPFLLVVDLGLPSEGGTTFRGGLDVLRHAAALPSPPPALLVADSIDDGLRAKARRLGVTRLAFKPGLSKLDPLQYAADLRAFGDKLARDLLRRPDGGRPAATAGRSATSSATLAGFPAAEEVARTVALQSAQAELGEHPDADLVSFLLLKATRAFFPRALLFVVKDERLRGLSGFGPTASGESLDLLARELVVPLDEPSPFAGTVVTGRAWSGHPPPEGPVQRLLERIGALGATDVAIVPVRAQRDTIAVLYGDTPGGLPLPPLDTLVGFVDRAGRALDEALLARRAVSR